MPKAYSYIRFSTPEQLKGDSLRRQAEASEKYAAENNLDLDTSLNLRDLGISAYDQSNLKRGALGQFVKLVDSGMIEKGSYLLVENLDRLSRGQVTEAVELFINIINSDITIVTLMDNQIYSRESINNNMSNLLMSIIIMSRASEESATKSKRIRASWDQKRNSIATKRLTKRCPYWLKPTADLTGFEFIPERVELVKRIFQMASDGMGNTIITRRLNEEKVKPFSDKTDGWQPTYIQKLLRNPAIYGDIHLKTQRGGEIKEFGEPIKNYYPAIMSKESWSLINQRRVERITKGGANKGNQLSNIFSGLLFCGHCGGPVTMGAHTKRIKDNTFKVRKYLGCSRGRRGLDCKHLTWGYDEFESEIIRFCRSIDFTEVIGKASDFTTELLNVEKRSFVLKERIESNEVKLKNLIGFIEEGNNSELDSVRGRIKEIEVENLGLVAEYENSVSLANKLAIKAKENINQQDAIINTLEKLQVLEGNELHDLRLKLSSQIKRAIHKISLFPGGEWITELKQKKLKDNLVVSGFEESEIKSYFHALSTPNRENKFIVLVFKNGEVLRLSKNEVMHNFKFYDKGLL